MLVVILYIGAVAVSVGFAEMKQDALAFHTRDYPFYLQFATKLLDSKISTKAYSINPEGYNVLFFSGTDGADGLHQSVHLEPMKYAYAALYSLTGSPRTLYAFVALVFFAPILYLTLVSPLDTVETRCFVVLLVLLYATSPASVEVSGFDLRPFAFLAPFFTLTMVAVTFRRPASEVLVPFAAMFLAREEALVLGLIVIGYALVRVGEPASRRALVAGLTVIWTSWLLVIVAYFLWTGYPNTLLTRLREASAYFETDPVAGLAAGVTATASVALLWFFGRYLYRRAPPKTEVLQVAPCSAVLPPRLLQFMRERSEALGSLNVIDMSRPVFAPRFGLPMASAVVLPVILWSMATKSLHRRALIMASAVVLLVILWSMATKSLHRRALISVAAVAVVASAAVAVAAPFGALARMASYTSRGRPASEVIALRTVTDKYNTAILTDYATFQAFADYDRVYAYQRLPWYVAAGLGRYYPANATVLQRLVKEQIEYIVISKANMENVGEVVRGSGMSTTTLFENGEFAALRVCRECT